MKHYFQTTIQKDEVEIEIEAVINYDYCSIYNEYEINSITDEDGYDIETISIREQAESEIQDLLNYDYREVA